EIGPFRRGRYAQSPRAGPPVHVVRQLLLQRRLERRRPYVVQRSLCQRLHGTLLRRLDAQLSRRWLRPTRLRPDRVLVGQRPAPQEIAAQLRRVREDKISQEPDLDRLLSGLYERNVQAQGVRQGEYQTAGAAHPHRISVVSAAHARRLPGPSV